MPEKRQVRIFYSYAHRDKELRDELARHLNSSDKNSSHIEAWHDREILGGENWASKIDTYLNNAHVILLLISADFMSSNYCSGKEMKRALEREEKKEAVVIPIIVRPVAWETAPFCHLQVLPPDAKPVTIWRNRDEVWVEVTKGIQRNIKDVLRKLYLEDAQAARAANRYEDARFAYAHITLLSSEDASAYQNLSSVLLQMDRLQPALKNIETSITLQPHDASSYAIKAKILSRQNQPDKALAAYQQAADLGADDFTVHEGMGDILLGQKEHNEALDAYSHAIHLEPKRPQLYLKKAEALTLLGRSREALNVYEQVTLLLPKDVDLHRNKGNIYSSIGEHRKALKAYEVAIALKPDDAELQRLKGLAHGNLKEWKLADLAYVRALKLEKNNAYYYKEHGDILFSLGRFQDAVTSYQTAIDTKTDFLLACQRKADVLEKWAKQARTDAQKLEAEQKEQKKK